MLALLAFPIRGMKSSLAGIALLLAFSSVLLHGQEKQPLSSITATTTLRRYVDLRLHWADWDEYSPLITWPDEPGWDCWWVAKVYRLGRTRTHAAKTLVPVTYTRLGLLCVGSKFEPNPKVETIAYELVRTNGAWQVDGPIPDYPYVGLPTVRKSLEKTIADPDETEENKEQARKSLNLLSAVAEQR
jgi:hypothetical protein